MYTVLLICLCQVGFSERARALRRSRKTFPSPIQAKIISGCQNHYVKCDGGWIFIYMVLKPRVVSS